MADFDVAIIGAGPAGLSAALNLARAKRSVLLIDASRPRNAATLHSHGYLTRDGVPPLELRALGRDEFATYPGGTFASAAVTAVSVADNGDFRLLARGVRGGAHVDASAARVIDASGLTETLPAITGLRAWYGTSLHSCMECDAYEKHGAKLVLIGESNDLAERAHFLSQWSAEITVFSNGIGVIADAEERALLTRGITVDRRPIAEVEGERGAMTGLRLSDGEVVKCDGGFVRPQWNNPIGYLAGLEVATDPQGFFAVDEGGRTSVPGLYAAGDVTPLVPSQLIVAAGHGAIVASAVNRDMIGSLL